VPEQDPLRNDRAAPRNSALHVYLEKLLDVLEPLRVPHSWFKHFYLLSVLSSFFWGYQLWSRGAFYRLVADYVSDHRYPMMKIDQLVVLWVVMLLQGSRRLYESYAYERSSRSTMWIGHWLMGLGFYLFINISIWIEGVGSSAWYLSCFPN
jgi:3-oxo-5-alpha-steroid 4-dehydrogenase 3